MNPQLHIGAHGNPFLVHSPPSDIHLPSDVAEVLHLRRKSHATARFHDRKWTSAYIASLRDAHPVAGPHSEFGLEVSEHATPSGIRVRTYRPVWNEPLPVVVFLHGGGWVAGSIEASDLMCKLWAVRANVVVVSVGYRLAPEHPYPTALDDTLEAIAWVRAHADEWGGDARSLALAGASAGANLATAAALRLRDEGEEQVECQILLYPTTDALASTASFRLYGEGFALGAQEARWLWDQYAPNPADRESPYVSPLRAASLEGMPSSLIITAEYDILRDEGESYGSRLLRDGVDARVYRYRGQVHGFASMIGILEDARGVIDLVSAYLTRHLATAVRRQPI